MRAFGSRQRGVLRRWGHGIAPARVPLILHEEREFCKLLSERIAAKKSVTVAIQVSAESRDVTGGFGFYLLDAVRLNCLAVSEGRERIIFRRTLYDDIRGSKVFDSCCTSQCKTVSMLAAAYQATYFRDMMPQLEVQVASGNRLLNKHDLPVLQSSAEKYGITSLRIKSLFPDHAGGQQSNQASNHALSALQLDPSF